LARPLRAAEPVRRVADEAIDTIERLPRVVLPKLDDAPARTRRRPRTGAPGATIWVTARAGRIL
jgi:hypothetical protein